MDLKGCTGFQWDSANADKIWHKHRVSRRECEQIFFNRPLIVADDEKHSDEEPRFYALGRTDEGRQLFVVFTIRGELIRLISARDMSRRERREFSRAEEAEENP
ncbi:MAG: BrnT family toxin [Gemmatimonadota bacterium]